VKCQRTLRVSYVLDAHIADETFERLAGEVLGPQALRDTILDFAAQIVALYSR
jgi:hypothetical protein